MTNKKCSLTPQISDNGAELFSDRQEERKRRARTIRTIFEEGDWLTASELNALQPTLPVDPAHPAHPASDWIRLGRTFSVKYAGKEYFPRYAFDERYQPLPVIGDVLAVFGELADPWRIAAWFHFPSPWLVTRDERGARNVAPKDALDRGSDVVAAAVKRASA
jgi:hypothetical protein